MSVLTCSDMDMSSLRELLQRFGIEVKQVNHSDTIPGSWFGDPEAGIIRNTLYVRADTPVHSALHESCHYICMSDDRRRTLHTNAGGDYDEENAVCYLSILLSDHLGGFDRQRMFHDMDAWGYTFRLGSSRAWFEEDAADAEQWLLEHKLIEADHTPCWRVRK